MYVYGMVWYCMAVAAAVRTCRANQHNLACIQEFHVCLHFRSLVGSPPRPGETSAISTREAHNHYAISPYTVNHIPPPYPHQARDPGKSSTVYAYMHELILYLAVAGGGEGWLLFLRYNSPPEKFFFPGGA